MWRCIAGERLDWLTTSHSKRDTINFHLHNVWSNFHSLRTGRCKLAVNKLASVSEVILCQCWESYYQKMLGRMSSWPKIPATPSIAQRACTPAITHHVGQIDAIGIDHTYGASLEILVVVQSLTLYRICFIFRERFLYMVPGVRVKEPEAKYSKAEPWRSLGRIKSRPGAKEQAGEALIGIGNGKVLADTNLRLLQFFCLRYVWRKSQASWQPK